MPFSATKFFSLAASTALLAWCFSASVKAQTNSSGTNTIEVRVLNSSTGQPALDPTVTVNGHVLTAKNGTYSLPAGTQSVMARAPGYRAVTVSAGAVQSRRVIELQPFKVHALYLSE